MLGPPRLNGHELAVVSFDRERHAKHGIARLDYTQGASYDGQLLIRRQLTANSVCQTILYESSGLVEEFIYRIRESILARLRGAREQVTSDVSRNAHRSQHDKVVPRQHSLQTTRKCCNEYYTIRQGHFIK